MKLLFGTVVSLAGLWVMLALLVRPQTWRAVVYGAAFVGVVSRHFYHITKTREVRLREQRSLRVTMREPLPDAAAVIEAIDRSLKENQNRWS